MGLKSWLARNTQTPAEYAAVYTQGLEDLIKYLAASLVIFSGHQQVEAGDGPHQVAFENSFEMQLSGYHLVTQDPFDLAEPSATKFQTEELFPSAYRAATAFLSLYSDGTARKIMGPENAELFVKSLHIAIAKRGACQYGFDPEPRNTFAAIQSLIPTFLCHRILNEESFGVDDGLGNILQHLSISPDGKTRYAFEVGSKKQIVGCAAHYLKVLMNVDDNMQRCAKDLRWQRNAANESPNRLGFHNYSIFALRRRLLS